MAEVVLRGDDLEASREERAALAAAVGPLARLAEDR